MQDARTDFRYSGTAGRTDVFQVVPAQLRSSEVDGASTTYPRSQSGLPSTRSPELSEIPELRALARAID